VVGQAKPALGHDGEDAERREVGQRLDRARRAIGVEPAREPLARFVEGEAEFDDRRLRRAGGARRLAGAGATLADIGETQRGGGDEELAVAEVEEMPGAGGSRL